MSNKLWFMKNHDSKQLLTYIALIILLSSGLFFLIDVLSDLREIMSKGDHIAGMDLPHFIAESFATLGMILASVLLWKFLQEHQKSAEAAISELQKTKQNIRRTIDNQLSQIGLTPTEKEVATLISKGFEIGEIAKLRGTSVGTIKAQSHSIYVKAGVSSKSELIINLLDD